VMSVIRVVLLLSLVWAIQGCGGEPAEETPADTVATTETPVEETPVEEVPVEETPVLSETIILPAGWEINDAVSVADVEAIIGRTGYQTWHEPLSDAAAGKPQGSFYDDSLAASTINFLVYCAEGQSNYDRVLGFVEDPVEVARTDGANPLWDQAVTGRMIDMADTLAVMLTLRGDVCIRIRFMPSLYPELDANRTLVKLTEMLINKLYGG
jgi:hypothetical protein